MKGIKNVILKLRRRKSAKAPPRNNFIVNANPLFPDKHRVRSFSSVSTLLAEGDTDPNEAETVGGLPALKDSGVAGNVGGGGSGSGAGGADVFLVYEEIWGSPPANTVISKAGNAGTAGTGFGTGTAGSLGGGAQSGRIFLINSRTGRVTVVSNVAGSGATGGKATVTLTATK